MSLFRFDLPEDPPGIRQEQPGALLRFPVRFEVDPDYLDDRIGELKRMRQTKSMREPAIFYMLASLLEQVAHTEMLESEDPDEMRIEVLAQVMEDYDEAEMAYLVRHDPLHYTQIKTLGRHLLMGIKENP